MASRIGLARVIEWAQSCDIEELHYVIHRVANIAQVRKARIEQADAHNQTKTVKRAGRTRKHRDTPEDVRLPSANDLDAVASEKAASAS